MWLYSDSAHGQGEAHRDGPTGRVLQLRPTWSGRSPLRQPTPWQSPANLTVSSFGCCSRFLLCYKQLPAFCHLTFFKLFFMDLLNDQRAKIAAIIQWWTGTYPKPSSNTSELQETSHFWAHLHLFPSTSIPFPSRAKMVKYADSRAEHKADLWEGTVFRPRAII